MDLRKPKHCIALHLASAAKGVTRQLDAALRPLGLTSAQFFTLNALDLEGEGTTTDLAQRLGSDRTTMSRNLDLMVRRGWVHRAAPDATQQRVCSLAPAGADLVRLARKAWKQGQADLTRSLGKSDAKALIRILRKLPTIPRD